MTEENFRRDSSSVVVLEPSGSMHSLSLTVSDFSSSALSVLDPFPSLSLSYGYSGTDSRSPLLVWIMENFLEAWAS